MKTREVQIVLIDDDSVDQEAVRRGLAKQRIANPVISFPDGLEALTEMRRENSRVRRPYMILLDLNMPRMGGHEFLRELRQDPELRDAVVFVLTTSASERDKCESYAFNVAGYVVKTRAGDDFVHMIGLLDCYWRLVEMPEVTAGEART